MIGRKIKEARLELGISQKQLAGDDITRVYISIIESGKALPSEKVVRILAQRLGKPLDFFLGDHLEDNIEISSAVLDRVRLKKEQKEYERALALVNKVFPMTQDAQILIEAYLLLFELHIEMKNFQQVLDQEKESTAIFKEHNGKDYVIPYYMLLGKAAFKLEAFHAACDYYTLALTHSHQLKRFQYEQIQCFIFLGTIQIRLGNLKKALESYEAADNEVAVTDYLNLKADICLGLGKAYFLSSLHEQAITATQKAIEWYGKDSNEDHRIYALNNLAVIEHARGNIEDAMYTLKMCYTIYQKKQQVVKQAAVLEELSILALKADNLGLARAYCDEGIKLLELEDNGILRACLYRIMGVLLHMENQLDLSYYLLRMSYDLLTRIHSHHEATISFELISTSANPDIKKDFLTKVQAKLTD